MPFARTMPAALAAAFCLVSAHAAFAAGLAIALVDQTPASVLMQDKASFEFPIRVNVTMPGADPIEPGAKLDANKLQITATLEKDGKSSPAMPLTYIRPNQFGGEITLSEPGSYTIDVTAHDPASGTTGVLKVHVAGLKAADYPEEKPAVILGPAAGAAAGRRGGGEE